ncbi:SMP-30/gluconolactonase/LRE family protein [Croceicoccus sediminis]|uniref:SMP-30/gluconolactonase/LRE family protein n=1 Tax=Croceicoccus sediminis TaxID=2571150 RepID=UPI0011844672|nr:SMP-30/gluconolactonase/LRE family protein [Croceicoccus sediminis]
MKEHQLTVLASDFIFPEGLIWRDGGLWMSDMFGKACFQLSAGGEKQSICSVPNRPSGIGFLPDGTPLVVSMVDRKLMKLVDGGLQVHADLSDVATGEVNDILVDDAGRAYVGNFGYDLFGGAEAQTANIAMVMPDGSVSIVADDLVFPNGMVLVDGGRTMVVSETFANRLTAYDVDEHGKLSNRRVYVDLGERAPDGLCVDKQDGIWVSSFVTGEFLRVTPDGAITDLIACGDKRAVACALGGEDGRTLYCSTFGGHLEDMVAQKRVGSIETVKVEVPGADF